MAMHQCCYFAKGAKRPSHTTNTIKFDRIPFDRCNSIISFDLCPFDQKNLTGLQSPYSDLIYVFKIAIDGSRFQHRVYLGTATDTCPSENVQYQELSVA